MSDTDLEADSRDLSFLLSLEDIHMNTVTMDLLYLQVIQAIQVRMDITATMVLAEEEEDIIPPVGVEVVVDPLILTIIVDHLHLDHLDHLDHPDITIMDHTHRPLDPLDLLYIMVIKDIKDIMDTKGMDHMDLLPDQMDMNTVDLIVDIKDRLVDINPHSTTEDQGPKVTVNMVPSRDVDVPLHHHLLLVDVD